MRRAVGLLVLMFACSPERTVLRGNSPLVPAFEAAAQEFQVPAELLVALAWTETGLIARATDLDADAHVPAQVGVMGLPVAGQARSLDRAAGLLGLAPEIVANDHRHNIRGAAAILRALADARYEDGIAISDRERWLRVGQDFLDAGDAGDRLALELRRTLARGLDTEAAGGSIIVPSFAELNTQRQAQSQGAEYPGAHWVAASASNFARAGRTAADIDTVVIHTVQGSYAGAISWFQNPSAQVSAHYVIRRSDGDITQMVRHADRAWHVGNYNQRSIGIEHEGWVSDANNYTPIMYQRSAELTAWLCDNLGIPKDRNHIIGHVEAPGATHTDPGRFWDWDLFMALVTGASPPPATGLLKGVVYRGTNTQDRIAGASVSVASNRVTADADGYFEFRLAPGDHTVTAEAPGFRANSVTRTVSAGGEIWGSVGLEPAVSPTLGIYRGVVYDSTAPEFSKLLPGATVSINGNSVTTGADGAFVFELAPGDYVASAELEGYTPGESRRTVTAGGVAWGSIGLVPQGATNRPPEVPQPLAPANGRVVRGAQPIFVVGGLSDPDGDPLSLQVALFGDAEAETSISEVTVDVPAATVRFIYPANDLPRSAPVFWRARAHDGQNFSGWSELQQFFVPDDGQLPAAPGGPYTATAEAGGVNQPPTAVLRSPTEGARVPTLALVADATDPEASPMIVKFQVATDAMFTSLMAESPALEVVAGQAAWTAPVGHGRYAVRAVAADTEQFGAWSAPVAVEVAVDAPQEDSGCTAVGGTPAAWLLLPLLLRRRRGG